MSGAAPLVTLRPDQNPLPLLHDGPVAFYLRAFAPASTTPRNSQRLWVGSFYKVHALGIRERPVQTGRSRRRRTLIILIEARNAVLHLKLRLA